MKLKIPIKGMHCRSCEMLIADELQEVDGVSKVVVSHTKGVADIEYDDKKVNEHKIKSVIRSQGYEV